MDAVVTAGGIPLPGEPLYEFTAGKPKAMLDFAGKPMIQWVLDALSNSEHVGRVVVVGLPPFTDIHCAHPMTIIDTQGSILANLKVWCGRTSTSGKYHVQSSGCIFRYSGNHR